MEADFRKVWEQNSASERNQHVTKDEARVHELHALTNRERAAKLLDTIAKSLQIDLRQKRILDVGSAYGGVPIVAAARGAETYGVETQEHLHRFAEANRLNEPGSITLINADLTDRDILRQLGPTPFDLIILNDVFERAYDTTALFDRLDTLSDQRTVLMFELSNGTCWQNIEREAHSLSFGITLLEPAAWGAEVGASFNVYYRPFSYYQLFCNAIGFSHLYVFTDPKMVETAKARVVAKFEELEQLVLKGPFRTSSNNLMAQHKFRRLKQQLAEDLQSKSSLYIHLVYDLYKWQIFASKKLIQPLENSSSTSRISFGTHLELERETEMAAPSQKRLVITIDVEASPYAQSSHHVDRLIWVRFGDEACNHVYSYLDQYFDTFGPNSVAVMIMHSWSFCYNERPSGFKVFKDYRLAQNFETFLANLPNDIEIVTAAQLNELAKSEMLNPALTRDVDLMDRRKHGARSL